MNELNLLLKRYIALIPFIEKKRYKLPISYQKAALIQKGIYNKNIDLCNIKKLKNELNIAIERSVFTCASFGVINFIPYSQNLPVIFDNTSYRAEIKSSGFYNLIPAKKSSTLDISKYEILNDYFKINFKIAKNNSIKILVNEKKYELILLDKKNMKLKISKFSTFIDNDIAIAVMEIIHEDFTQKVMFKLARDCERLFIDLVLDRKTKMSTNYYIKIHESEGKLTTFSNESNCMFNQDMLIISVPHANIDIRNNMLLYKFSSIKDNQKAVREHISLEITANRYSDISLFRENMNLQLLLASNPIIKIFNENREDDLQFYYCDESSIILQDIYLSPDSRGLILKIKNSSNEEKLARIKYIDLEPQYIINENFEKTTRLFGGIKLIAGEEALILVQ